MLIITAVVAAILSVLFVMLSANVIGLRRSEKVSVGEADSETLLRAVRAHANLAEYAPITLFLIACLEINGAPRWLIAPLALVFVAGRILHPIGMKKPSEMALRVRGMQLTFLGMAALAAVNVLWLLWMLFT